MKSVCTLSEARRRLSGLLNSGTITAIEERSKGISGYVVPADRLEALFETLEVLSNPAAMNEIRGRKERGRMIAWKEIERELDDMDANDRRGQ
jgi:PHD/YefM family antitoxin component YafN of YafNO toxin-antitoxin module